MSAFVALDLFSKPTKVAGCRVFFFSSPSGVAQHIGCCCCCWGPSQPCVASDCCVRQKGVMVHVPLKVPFSDQPAVPVSAFLLCAGGFFLHVIAAAYVYRASQRRKEQDAHEVGSLCCVVLCVCGGVWWWGNWVGG